MCGIVGYIGSGDPIEAVLDGLARLEYRGYDSAGIALVDHGNLKCYKVAGRVAELVARVSEESTGQPALSAVIGHTRWATHGRPNTVNAHPHCDPSGQLAIVHNGIIENCTALRAEIEATGQSFQSETDSEVIAHLIAKYDEGDLVAAVEKTLMQLEGTFAIGVVSARHPGLMVGARRGSPLVVGVCEGATMLASDTMPILPYTRNVCFLEEDDVVVLRAEGVEIRRKGCVVEGVFSEVDWDVESAEKGGYDSFMLKEIYEQPVVLERLVRTRILDHGTPGVAGAPGTPPRLNLDGIMMDSDYARDISRIVIVGQGTAYHAAMIGRNMIERVARIPTYAEFASDFRYREPVLDPSVLVIAVTQSGETLDTLEGVRLARLHGCRVLSVVNAVGSSIARESDDVFYMNCGMEIGVASTKAFTAMVASLYMVAIHLGLTRNTLSAPDARRRVADLSGIGARCETILTTAQYIRQVARKYKDSANFLFLGRGTGWPLAMEGALKLKEVSYIHAEGYNAAEMKHGPIALIDENMPVVVIALQGRRYDKIVGNIQEVKARGGKVIALASHDDTTIADLVDDVIYINAESGIMNSIVCAVPLQLLAYDIATMRGCDVDKPKNLAKSVTVE